MRKAFLLALLLFLIVPIVHADTTQQYNKIYLNPFYTESMTRDQNYTFSFDLQPPDRIKEVKTAIISFDININPTVRYYLWINNQVCNTPSVLMHTTYLGASQVRVNFDCSNIITREGNYNVTLMGTGSNSGATLGWAEITYMNNPVKLQVFGTEYFPNPENETATVFIQVIENNEYVTNSECISSVFHPNGTKILNQAPLTYVDDGIYRKDFPIPQDLGVYPISVQCTLPVVKFTYLTTNATLVLGSTSTGSNTDITIVDGIYWNTIETSAKEYQMDINFTGITIDANTSALDFVFTGKWESTEAEEIVIQMYNFTSGTWFNLSNHIPRSFIDLITTNQYSGNLSQVLQGGVVSFRLIDTTHLDSNRDNLYIDQVKLETVDLEPTPIEVVKSSGELHVTRSILANLSIEGINDTLASGFNSRFDKIDTNLNEVNLTTHRNENVLLNVNASATQINFTTLQILGIVQEINMTTHDTNVNVYINQGKLDETLTNLNTLNQTMNTVHSNVNELNNTLTLLYSDLLSINSSLSSELSTSFTSLLNAMNNANTSLHLKLDDLLVYSGTINNTVSVNQQKLDEVLDNLFTMNNTLNLTYANILDINNTLTFQLNTLSNQINNENVSIQSKLDELITYSNDVNNTVTINMNKLDQVLDYADSINATVNLSYIDIQTLKDFAVQINSTTLQTLGIATSNQGNITINQNLLYDTLDYLSYVNMSVMNLSSDISVVNANTQEIIGLLNGLANLTADQVWSYSSRTLTDYNNSELVSLLQGMSNLTAQDVWTYSNRTLTYFDYETQALFVWNSTSRELTEYNTTGLQTSIDLLPSEASIWNYATRTLTDYNNTQIYENTQYILGNLTSVLSSLSSISSTLSTMTSTLSSIQSTLATIMNYVSDSYDLNVEINQTTHTIESDIQSNFNVTISNITAFCNSTDIATAVWLADVTEVNVSSSGEFVPTGGFLSGLGF